MLIAVACLTVAAVAAWWALCQRYEWARLATLGAMIMIACAVSWYFGHTQGREHALRECGAKPEAREG